MVDGPLDLSGLQALYALRRPELKYPTFTPQTPAPLAGGEDVDIFWAMRGGDVLLHHPYDSFTTTVEAFVDAGRARPATCSRSSRRCTGPVATKPASSRRS